VADDELLLAEIHRVLRPGGKAIFMIPVHEEQLDIPSHLRNYTPNEFIERLRPHFDVERIEENDTISRLIALWALKKRPFYLIMKRLLIAISSCIPHRAIVALDNLMKRRGFTPSQLSLVATKR
jgi:SAM-dependent methyltransferase